jgi:2-dehydropantoate 2-reductase
MPLEAPVAKTRWPGIARQRSLPHVIAVVGVGAVGGVVAARLASRGDVCCCVRTPFRELVVEAPGGVRMVVSPRVETDPARVEPARFVLLATKVHQIEGAAPWLEALVGPDTRVAVLQNGVEHAERVAAWVAPAQVVPVVVLCPCVAVAPGHIEQRMPARLIVPAGEGGAAFAALFAGSAVEVVLSEEFRLDAWRKLCLNAVSGALAALAGRPVPEIDASRRERIGRALALECAAVARAEGAALSDAEAQAIADRVARMTSGGAPSILADRLAGRPLEWDARNGAVVRLGARHGIDAPHNRRACALLREAHRRPGDLLDELLR